MESRRDLVEKLRKQLPVLRRRFGLKRMALFGSYGRDEAGKESDVDLLVEFERPVGLKFTELAEYLEEVLDKKVDLLTPVGLKSIRAKETKQSIEKEATYV